MEIHHINSFSEYPELDSEDANLICLCTNCHRTLEKDRAIILYQWLLTVEYPKNKYWHMEKKWPTESEIRKILKAVSEMNDESHMEIPS